MDVKWLGFFRPHVPKQRIAPDKPPKCPNKSTQLTHSGRYDEVYKELREAIIHSLDSVTSEESARSFVAQAADWIRTVQAVTTESDSSSGDCP
jgi:hypothetical protein